MYTRNKIALMIENKLGYTNGWKVDDETYERECLMIADEIIQLFSIPVVVGQSEQLACSCGSIKVQTTGGSQCPNNRCSSAN